MSKFKNFSFGLVLMPFLLFGCFKKESRMFIKKSIVNESIESEKNDVVQDVIAIIFDKGVQLKWNVVKNKIIKDSTYNEILKDKKKIEILVNNISNNEDLKIKLCSKKTATLKKGDIAFIYLYENKKIYLFTCLKTQFDVVNEACEYPDELLDYIEKNRFKVQKQIGDCIK
ncbi:hypothetical protein B0A69_21635 [Chryseobacterium shigense]|uniref:Lipoprotein n=1 Tax=Chryseobacterium shigense TaxID=297244 RepID=A0A1N7JJZ7_9FLAO|nr:hypothetical protein [Chryseobacterium shigense]PQA89888.1 hypothetical protein B0A69_21635 [Chryseobacterium shigense]SIS49692.1 hypothetical protein SAMN05421639_1073 [Chryseobacterium shigense]